jgi:hypothetical protein
MPDCRQPSFRMSLVRPKLLALVLPLVSACGGGDMAGSALPPTLAERAAATRSTVATNAACSESALGSFYWEIGSVDGPLVSGSVGRAAIGPETLLNIASASKWPFAAYVVERFGLQPQHLPYLNFTSGYSNFDNSLCSSSGTVAQCLNGSRNVQEASTATFHYQGGHIQQLAVDLGLGGLRNLGLTSELRSQLGSELQMSFVQPLPPGGVRTTARAYASFLRKLLVGSPDPLRLASLLGSHAVCTQPSATCNASTETAALLPEEFHYSIGHWVEDDPVTTPAFNRAYSSAGKFGFYPWVSTDRTLYGVIAREDVTVINGEGYSSLRCGRLLRQAWLSGLPVK